MTPRTIALLGALLLAAVLSACGDAAARGDEPAALRDAVDLSLDSLGAPPPDASNRWADDRAAAALGHRLFFDKRLSSNGEVSCATCHDPRRNFQDATPLAKGVGTTARRTMPIAATAHSPFLFWDGRKDSQWSQALGPLESPVEHGGDRTQYARLVATHYRGDYERVFGPLPDLRERDGVTRVFVNIGKAIAAYERRIAYAPSRFDRFAAQWKKTGRMPTDVLDAQERAGFELFRGKAHCTQCHNGPLFTNNEFHNTGVPARAGIGEDHGRFPAIAGVRSDEFNCRSRWSDAGAGDCTELEYLAPASAGNERAFKVPSLRNVAERAPYMHAGQLSTLKEVLEHYNRAPAAPRGHSELEPLGLSAAEIAQLEAFLRTLSGGLAAPAGFLEAP
jgi:cytochrome c peroxidase